MRFFAFLIIPLLFTGCYSKCGFTDKYYCNCEEYYDANGVFHRKCPDDFVHIDIGARFKNTDGGQSSEPLPVQ
jgi:hypothetical protein